MSAETLDAFAKRIAELGAGELRRRIAVAMTTAGLKGERAAKLAATTSPRVRSGRLRASIAGRVESTQDGLRMTLAAGGRSPRQGLGPGESAPPGDVPYARIQEEGGIVRPRRSRYLTIPIHPSLFTAAGDQRYPSARMVPGLVFRQSARGQPLLVHKDTGEVYYLLRQQVRIRPKRYLRKGIDAALEAMPAELRPVVEVAILQPSGGASGQP